jgi:SAM-dependent methyltransferase
VDGDPFASNRDVFDTDQVVAAYRGSTDLMEDERLHFDAYVARGARILDLGVGTGRTTPYLAARASTYVGIDYAPSMVEQARQLHDGVDLRVADASDLSQFVDDSFDVVVFSYNGLDYLYPDSRREQCLLEIHRVLRRGGHLVMSQHNPRGLVDPLPHDQPLVRRLLVQTFVAARRARRLVSTAAFWRGSGYVLEPARGGLVHHMAGCRAVTAELDRYEFTVVSALSARARRRRSAFTTPWYSYVAVTR